MLVIRLQRVGRKHQPSYRVVVAERRSKLKAPPVEDLGFYNPFDKKAGLVKERIQHWLKIGAKASPTAHNLFVKNGVVEGPKLKIYMKKKIVEAVSETPAPTPAAATETAPTENIVQETPTESSETAQS